MTDKVLSVMEKVLSGLDKVLSVTEKVVSGPDKVASKPAATVSAHWKHATGTGLGARAGKAAAAFAGGIVSRIRRVASVAESGASKPDATASAPFVIAGWPDGFSWRASKKPLCGRNTAIPGCAAHRHPACRREEQRAGCPLSAQAGSLCSTAPATF